MRARIISLFILLVLLGIPLTAYWYFMYHRVASLTLKFTHSSPVSVTMRGTTGISWLPLFDRFLSFEKVCESVCEWSPLPPAQYEIHIQGENIVPLSDQVTLTV